MLVSVNSLLTLILQELSTTQEIEDIVQLSETDRLQIATDITEAVTFLHNLSQVFTVMTKKYETASISLRPEKNWFNSISKIQGC